MNKLFHIDQTISYFSCNSDRTTRKTVKIKKSTFRKLKIGMYI